MLMKDISVLSGVGPGVGSTAPEIVVTGLERQPPRGQPRVLAFAHAWSFAHEPPAAIRAIRTQLRGLGAELLVLSQGGLWLVRADDAVDQLVGPAEDGSHRLATEVRAAAARYGVPDGRDAVFVIDGCGIVRFTYRPDDEQRPVCATLAEALATAGSTLHAQDDHVIRQRVLFNRREWTVTCLVAGCATAFLSACKEQPRTQAEPRRAPPDPGPPNVDIKLTINGEPHRLSVDPRASLLDVLRERLGLTGTKKGCDAGQCGACTVLRGGQPINACLTLAVMAQDRDITTIEGLEQHGVLHPMQQAFIEHDGLQCGYCTPGQILSAVALLDEGHAVTDAEVREQMSGNLCRCGAYPNIIAAIQAARRARG